MATRTIVPGFPYPTLCSSPTSFRLLKLLDESEDPKDLGCSSRIVAKLLTFSSPTDVYTPKYKALSYTWGSPFPPSEGSSRSTDWDSPTQHIICNGQRFYVCQNLYDAMQELVRRGRFEFYWIDFLCINQNETVERNVQVAVMGDIFRNASEVICWLGREDEYVDDVVELHRRMAVAEKKLGGIKRGTLDPDAVDGICGDSAMATEDFKDTMLLCESCKIFWDRRWFTRLWIAQEIALAKRITVFCGRRSLDWLDMVLVAEHAKHANSNIAWGSYYHQGARYGISIRRFERLRQHQSKDMRLSDFLHKVKPKGEQSRNAFLMEVLSMTTHLEAMDPRDKIYGVLGLLLKTPLSDEGQRRKPIQIDYGLSTHELYTQFAAILILGLPYLSLLGCDTRDPEQVRTRDEGLPSWVPDFAMKGFSIQKIADRRHKAGVVRGRRGLRKINDNVLQLAGHPLDTVSFHCTLVSCMEQLQCLLAKGPHTKLQPDLMESFCRTKLDCFDHTEHLSQARKTVFHAFLLVGMHELAASGKQKSLDALIASLETLRHKDSNDMIPTQQTIDTWSVSNLETQADQTEIRKFRQMYGYFQARARRNALVFTKSGLCAGTSFDCRTGDQIWIIRDAATPILLRPIPGTSKFSLIGEAYVDGVMFGEALKDPNCPKPIPIEIV